MRQLLILGLIAAPGLAAEQGGRQAILDQLTTQARAADPGFTGFSAQRGEALFRTEWATGKPDTPACTSCHDPDPAKPGMTRAGKVIPPMAVSARSDRYTDPANVAKWFTRNCTGVLGRECTPVEKGDFLTFMSEQ